MSRLKALKKKLQSWSNEVFGDIERNFKEAHAKLEEIDIKEWREGVDFDYKKKRGKSYFS